MPGIAGIISPAQSPEFEQVVRRMVATMQHQPDSESGTVFVPELGVYGGWVAHAGSYAGRQSAARSGPSRMLFSGECFGPDMQPDGALHARYVEAGERFVATLNGPFSGLLIDRARGHALLFNDRYGLERLYVFEKDGATYFASEAKALLAVLPELRAFDDTGVAQFLAFGSTIGGHTLFRGLRLMPGGSSWRFTRDAPVHRSRYFTPNEWEQLPPYEAEEFEARFADTFRQLVPGYLHAEQTVGLSLTGGLDTRMILACLPRALRPAVAYTYAADNGDALLDLTIARRVAAMRGIEHHALRVGADFLAGFAHQLDRTVYVTDGCAGVMGAHEVYLSEQARHLAPVRLTGNFGSEVLRGMSTFKRNGPSSQVLDPAFAARIDTIVAEQQARRVHPVTHAAFEEVPWHLFGTMAAGRSQLTFRSPYMDRQLVELAYRMPEPLRHTARSALRLIHDNDAALSAVPTDRGVTWAGTGPTGRLHRLYCSVTFKMDYWHKEGLPDALTSLDRMLEPLSMVGLLGLHKFLAYRVWFRNELSPYAAQVVSDPRVRSMPFWEPRALESLVQEHASGRRNRLRDIHAVLTLEAVHRKLICQSAYPTPVSSSPLESIRCPTL